MYCTTNFKTKKAVKQAIAAGEEVTVFSPAFAKENTKEGICYLEGPHYPEPHRWYGQGILKDSKLIAIR